MIKEVDTISVSDLYDLLDEAYFALKNITVQSIPDGEGGSTAKLAKKIKNFLGGDDEQE